MRREIQRTIDAEHDGRRRYATRAEIEAGDGRGLTEAGPRRRVGQESPGGLGGQAGDDDASPRIDGHLVATGAHDEAPPVGLDGVTRDGGCGRLLLRPGPRRGCRRRASASRRRCTTPRAHRELELPRHGVGAEAVEAVRERGDSGEHAHDCQGVGAQRQLVEPRLCRAVGQRTRIDPVHADAEESGELRLVPIPRERAAHHAADADRKRATITSPRKPCTSAGGGLWPRWVTPSLVSTPAPEPPRYTA